MSKNKGTELITLRRADNDISEDDDDSYKPGPYWSLMLEISEGPLKEISNSTLVEQVRKEIFCRHFFLTDGENVIK